MSRLTVAAVLAGLAMGGQAHGNEVTSRYAGDKWVEDTAQAESVWLGGLRIGRVAGGQLHFVHSDHLGSGRALTNGVGQVEWRWTGDGMPDDGSGGQPLQDSDWRFPGQRADGHSTLSYNHHRYYDPDSGRYNRADPLGMMAGNNPYVYAGGDRVNQSDESGLLAPVVWLVLGGIGSLLTAYEVFGPMPAVEFDSGRTYPTVGPVDLGSSAIMVGQGLGSAAVLGSRFAATAGRGLRLAMEKASRCQACVKPPPYIGVKSKMAQAQALAARRTVNGEDYVELWRGVSGGSVGSLRAIEFGDQLPRGFIGGKFGAWWHNSFGAPFSTFTSWSYSPAVAASRFAREGGTLMRVTVPLGRIVPSVDHHTEFEVLLAGRVVCDDVFSEISETLIRELTRKQHGTIYRLEKALSGKDRPSIVTLSDGTQVPLVW